MINEDGQIVIQHHDGELPQGIHIVNEGKQTMPFYLL